MPGPDRAVRSVIAACNRSSADRCRAVIAGLGVARPTPAITLAGNHMSAMTTLAPSAATAGKPSLAGLDRAGLAAALAAVGVPERQVRMRVAQLWHWLYVRGATDFAAMTNISRDLRAALADAYAIARPEIVSEQISADGTRKWLLRFPAPAPAGRSRWRPSTSPRRAAARSACRARSAARCRAPSATPAPRRWCAT